MDTKTRKKKQAVKAKRSEKNVTEKEAPPPKRARTQKMRDEETEDPVEEFDSPSKELQSLKKKYNELKELRSTASEKLLKEHVLHCTEKQNAADALVTQLQAELEKMNENSAKPLKETATLKKELDNANSKHETLLKKVASLEKSLASEKTKHSKTKQIAKHAAEETDKILSFYSLMTGLEAQLDSTEKDKKKGSEKNKFICVTENKQEKKHFKFSILLSDTDLEYAPIEVGSTTADFLKGDFVFEADQGPIFLTKIVKELQQK